MLERAPIEEPVAEEGEPQKGFFADLVETPFVAATEIVDGVSEEVVEIIDDVPHDTEAEAKEKTEQAPL